MGIFDVNSLASVCIVCGHYGVGKTNLSINLALDCASAGCAVELFDMDVVNPYFRSSDYRRLLEEAGVKVEAPVFAGTALDAPSLTGVLHASLKRVRSSEKRDALKPAKLIIDAGGDDVGATALGRFSSSVKQGPYQMLYVANCFRNLTQDPNEALVLLREIQRKSFLEASHIVSNAHMREATDAQHIRKGIEFSHHLAQMAELPFLFYTAPKEMLQGSEACFFPDDAVLSPNRNDTMLYPVEMFVRTPWE